MAAGSGGFLVAKDMMRESAAAVGGQRGGSDKVTELLFMYGTYAVFALWGVVGLVIGAVVFGFFLLAFAYQDYRFSGRTWKPFVALLMAGYGGGLAGVYWLSMRALAPLIDTRTWSRMHNTYVGPGEGPLTGDSAHAIAAVLALPAGVLVFFLLRKLRKPRVGKYAI